MGKNGSQRRKSRAGDWFRVGVFSATAIAPLVARWNDLRMAERARSLGKDLSALADDQTRDLRQVAAEQARDLSELAAQRSQEWAELARARSNEWRDLAADRAGEWGGIASERARALGDQASALSEDLLALAATRAGLLREQAAGRLEDARQQFLATKAYGTLKEAVPVIARLDNRKSRRTNTTLWLLGVGLGLIGAAIGIVIVARRRMAEGAGEPLVELPRDGASNGATSASKGAPTNSAPKSRGNKASGNPASQEGPVPNVAGALSGLRAAAEHQGIHSMRDIDTTQDANAAPLVGNIHTQIYHDASDVSNLPSEENRVYFANEDEARAAGFRPSRPTAVEHNESHAPRP